MKNIVAILSLIILNIIGIMVNISIVFEGKPSYFNFIFSLFYLFAWISFGIYFYIKKGLTVHIYMLVHWIIVLGVSMESLTIILLNAQVAVGTSKFSIIDILFTIIFLTPLDGLNVFFKLPAKELLFSVILISIIFVILLTLSINITRKRKLL